MSAKDEKKNSNENAAADGAGNKGPVIAAVIVVVVIAAVAMFMMSGNGSAQSEKDGEGTLSSISPASADGEGGADAPMIKLGNPVVAVVNGEEIKRSDVFNYISGLPEQVRQMPIQTLFPAALDQVINNKLVVEKAGTANLEGDPEVEQLVTQAKDQIIRNVYLDRQIDKEITQKKLLDAYNELLTNIGEIQETQARHILVEDEATARDLITKLGEGADFETLAKENSKGPSASKGGELGWFAKSEMVPEFAEAAFALNKGEFSKDPVKTQFGFHIIKVDDRRKRPEPEFETVKPQLEAQLRQRTLNDIVMSWQKDAKIEKFDINGEKAQN